MVRDTVNSFLRFLSSFALYSNQNHDRVLSSHTWFSSSVCQMKRAVFEDEHRRLWKIIYAMPFIKNINISYFE